MTHPNAEPLSDVYAPDEAQIAAWVAATAPALGIELDAARAARVAGHLGRSWHIA